VIGSNNTSLGTARARRTPFRMAAIALLVAGAVAAAAAAASSSPGTSTPGAHAASAQQCGDPYSATRDPSNPLMLSTPPGSNPLQGARFFVDGPRHGAAASAIATMLGRDPQKYPDNYSWTRFREGLARGSAARKLERHGAIARKVSLLEKIADQPESQRISSYSEGGGPGGIFGQTEKIFCHNKTADPGSIPVFTTYFLHASVGGCATPAELQAAGPDFTRRVDEMADATGNRPAVFLLEIDGVGSSKCFAREGSMGLWEGDLRYEAQKMSALPHTVVYLEAGYSDANSARYTAQVLNASGVRSIRGFYTNDTHSNWTIDEIRWGQKVSRLTGGAHFIVNTATNGRGPLRPHNRVELGNEVLCNPPGRGIGPLPTTTTGFPMVDAFLWTGPPGNSSGHCNGGTSPGTFWTARAIELAARAQNKLGPGYPRNPY
jgi:endoglucanase